MKRSDEAGRVGPSMFIDKVIHVTESMSAGVLDVLRNLSMQQINEGVAVSIIYCTRRPETPVLADLEMMFSGVALYPVADADAGTIQRISALRDGLRSALKVAGPRTIVHLHSSYAGAAGRSLSRKARGGVPFIYSPHGYAHLREDKSKLARRAFAAAEAFLAWRGDGTIAVSQGEAVLAATLSDRPVRVLPNRLNLGALGRRTATDAARPVVGNIGRAAPQKGFDRFAMVARKLSNEADFRWIGGGDSDAERQLSDAGVAVTGWVDRATALKELRALDVLLFPSRWEGMPIALMEAQALGIPAVAYSCVGVSDVLVPNKTGVIVRNVDEATDGVTRLIRDVKARRQMSQAAASYARRFDLAGYGRESLALYAEIGGEAATRLAGLNFVREKY